MSQKPNEPPMLSQEDQRTCRSEGCKGKNPTWHTFIHQRKTWNPDVVGWQCNNCPRFTVVMSYADYNKLVGKK